MLRYHNGGETATESLPDLMAQKNNPRQLNTRVGARDKRPFSTVGGARPPIKRPNSQYVRLPGKTLGKRFEPEMPFLS